MPSYIDVHRSRPTVGIEETESDCIDEMRKQISQALAIEVGSISIKASTSEGLGFTGRGEGIAAVAVALLEDIE